MVEQLRILHLNDLHSHFEAFPKIERFFEAASDTPFEVIKLDIGDNIDSSHPLTEASQGTANIQLMNRLGIDYATIGNNEGVGLTKSELNQVYHQADFAVILNNLKDNQERPTWASPYQIHTTKEGTRIAFLGYTFPYYKTYTPNGWQIEDPLTCLKQDLMIEEVASADMRIIISHLGIRLDEQITEEFDQIDLIIGSHTHHVFEDGACLNGTYLAAAGKYGQYVGEINLRLENHQLQEIEIIAHETSHLPSHPEDAAFTQELIDQGKAILNSRPLKHFEHALTQNESLDLLMKAMLDYAQVDICIINSGLMVEPFAKDLTEGNLHASLPHQMRLAKVELGDDDLLLIFQDIFRQAELLKDQEIRGMGFRGHQFGQIAYAGFTYKSGKIVYNDKVMGKLDKVQLVLVDQYYFASYFQTIKKHAVQLLFPDLLRHVMANYIKKLNEKGDQ
ncbi:bifunctional metallophosphatase/5'-nucleotidase [Streptococcus hongkongensis]|nr:phosphoesterase [Streptococcus uberis]